ncbi:MAG TPA: ABC transporter substrate-binding protein [Vicinamibacterales bacterium]|nr:ABC transporter substrate-binding protein [Vicinamibacterales bacterium]
MARRLTILVALLLTGGLLALAAVLWRPGVRTTPPATQVAGGTLVASLRSEPTGYNRYVEITAAGELVSLLTDGRLVRVDRAADTVEPALAETWSQSDDGLTYTFALRQGVRFSDGVPFTSDDVLFSARVLYDPAVNSPVGAATRVAGAPLRFEADGPHTVKVTLPSRFEPGLRLLENVPILPKHRLEAALNQGRLRDAWKVGTPLAEIAGLGPFTLVEHTAGQRLVFRRNEHYWRRDAEDVRLPYLDTLIVAIIPDQNTEALRLEAGEIDLMANADIRPEDYASFKRAADAGRLRLIDVGVGLDPNLLWFNLSPKARTSAPWLQQAAFRRAVSHAVNRQTLVDTVYLGAAVPIFGPITPGNATWYSPSVPTQPYDPARARELLASIGLVDRNGDRIVDDEHGRAVRFSILTQRGHTLRERTAAVIQDHLRQVGVQVDVAAVDPLGIRQRWVDGDYDSIYFGVQASATDPALNPDFWLSSGPFHFWNPNQASPSTAWEAEIDELMRRQAAAPTLAERQQIMVDVQRILAEHMPAVYFVAPRVTVAVSRRVANVRPVLQIPHLLWSAETLAVVR